MWNAYYQRSSNQAPGKIASLDLPLRVMLAGCSNPGLRFTV
jgi:hypothetical protein